MAALRSDVDLVSWPSDSEMTVVRVNKQRRALRLARGLAWRLGDGETCPLGGPGDPLQPHSPSLVNLATMEEAEGDDQSDCLEPLTSWGVSPRGTLSWGTALELGDVLRCCPPRLDGGAAWPAHAAVRNRSRSPKSALVIGKQGVHHDDDGVLFTAADKQLDVAVQTVAPDTKSVCVGDDFDDVMVRRPSSRWWRSAWDLCARCVERQTHGQHPDGSVLSVPYTLARQ